MNREPRLINRGGKNWRLGGRQVAGEDFAKLDSRDFALIRSVRHNDGSSPILLTFISRQSQRVVQAGLVATLSKSLHQSVAVFHGFTEEFKVLADLFPPVPATVAVQRTTEEQQAFV